MAKRYDTRELFASKKSTQQQRCITVPLDLYLKADTANQYRWAHYFHCLMPHFLWAAMAVRLSSAQGVDHA